MDMDTIKPFINHDVEMLVGGTWIEGHLTPIVKGLILLYPIGEAKNFYGPCALKAEFIQAIRQVKKSNSPPEFKVPEVDTRSNITVRSGLDQVTPEQRFGKK
jgi:hypothetical protein